MHPSGEHRRRQKRRTRGALELAGAHLPQKSRVGGPAAGACCEVRSGGRLLLGVGGPVRVRVDCRLAVVAHPASGGDRRYLIELSLRTARRSEYGLDRFAHRFRGALDAEAMRGHDRHHPLLERVELRHEIGGRGNPLLGGHEIKRLVVIAGEYFGNWLEVHAAARADVQIPSSRAILGKQVADRRPKRALQVLLIADRLTGHHDQTDCLVHKLVPRVDRQAGYVSSPVKALAQFGILGLRACAASSGDNAPCRPGARTSQRA